MDKLIAYNCIHHTIQVLPVPSRVHDITTVLNRCIGDRKGGGLRYAHFDYSVFQVWDMQTGCVSGVWWKLVHQVSLMELVERNVEATALVTEETYLECCVNVMSVASLFSVRGFHPTADIIFLEGNANVGAYSIEHGKITYQCPGQYFNNVRCVSVCASYSPGGDPSDKEGTILLLNESRSLQCLLDHVICNRLAPKGFTFHLLMYLNSAPLI